MMLSLLPGNPHVLYQDTMWKSLLRYAVQCQAYVGCDVPELGEDETESGTEQEVQASGKGLVLLHSWNYWVYGIKN